MKKKVSVTLDEHALSRVDALAKRMSVNRSGMIEMLMRDGLWTVERALTKLEGVNVAELLNRSHPDQRDHVESLMDENASPGTLWAAATLLGGMAADKAKLSESKKGGV